MVIEANSASVAIIEAKNHLEELQNSKYKNKHYDNAIEYLNRALVCLQAADQV